MPDPTSARVFISYSRKDGGAFAADLREMLLKQDLSVWQDIIALEGGRDWWSQIEEAIGSKALQHFVLVVTPAALASPVVHSMFEPIHGSAFDIMGKGVANPVGTFWSAVMMLDHLGEAAAAQRLMKAIERVTADPDLHTPDLGGAANTRKVTDAVIRAIQAENV